MSITPDYPKNVPDAKQGVVDSVAAPGFVGVGGTNEPRNKAAWLSVSNFLATQNLRMVLRARSGAAPALAGGSAAQSASFFLPVGNHGEIFLQGAQA